MAGLSPQTRAQMQRLSENVAGISASVSVVSRSMESTAQLVAMLVNEVETIRRRLFVGDNAPSMQTEIATIKQQVEAGLQQRNRIENALNGLDKELRGDFKEFGRMLDDMVTEEVLEKLRADLKELEKTVTGLPDAAEAKMHTRVSTWLQVLQGVLAIGAIVLSVLALNPPACSGAFVGAVSEPSASQHGKPTSAGTPTHP